MGIGELGVGEPVPNRIDSTDTVYVTDHNHRVSAFSTQGQFLKCFGKEGTGLGELQFPKGIAVDNTGNIYVCDYYASVGGATRHTVVVRVCLSVCLSALVLKDGEESAGGKCNIDITR